MIPLHELSTIGKHIETENRFVIARGWGCVGRNGE